MAGTRGEYGPSVFHSVSLRALHVCFKSALAVPRNDWRELVGLILQVAPRRGQCNTVRATGPWARPDRPESSWDSCGLRVPDLKAPPTSCCQPGGQRPYSEAEVQVSALSGCCSWVLDIQTPEVEEGLRAPGPLPTRACCLCASEDLRA